MLSLAIVSVIGLAVSCAANEGNALSSSVSRFLELRSAETADNQTIIASSGAVFTEFIKADKPTRIAAIRQLIAAYARATDMGEALLPYVLLHQLPVNQEELALAVGPRLFDSNEEVARKWARVFADRLGSESLSGYVDLREIGPTIAAFPKDPEVAAIVRFLYQKSPSSALAVMARRMVRGKEEYALLVHDRRITTYLLRSRRESPIDSAEAAAIKVELRELAESPHSWVRLYVAEMMLQNSLLHDEAIVGKLAEDKDELVALAVRDLQNPKEHFRHRSIRAPWSDL